MSVHMHAHAHTRTHTYAHTHTHAHTHAHTHMYMYTYTQHIHTHTHTHTHTPEVQVRIPSRGMGTFFPHAVSSIFRLFLTHTHTHTHTAFTLRLSHTCHTFHTHTHTHTHNTHTTHQRCFESRHRGMGTFFPRAVSCILRLFLTRKHTHSCSLWGLVQCHNFQLFMLCHSLSSCSAVHTLSQFIKLFSCAYGWWMFMLCHSLSSCSAVHALSQFIKLFSCAYSVTVYQVVQLCIWLVNEPGNFYISGKSLRNLNLLMNPADRHQPPNDLSTTQVVQGKSQ